MLLIFPVAAISSSTLIVRERPPKLVVTKWQIIDKDTPFERKKFE